MSSYTSDQTDEIIYTADSQLRRPRLLWRRMLGDLAASRELAWRLFVRNISTMYRQTTLGYLWVFLPPILTTVVFVFLNSQKIVNIGETDIPYPAYVMVGTLLWQGFVDAMNSPLRILNQSKSFLIKINFPREALIFAAFGEVLFNFSIRLVLVVAVFFWYKLSLPLTIVLAPMGILGLIILGLVLGILLAPVGLLYHDIEKALPLITYMWLFLTPVLYPPPTSWPASLISSLNPVSPLLVTTREMITTGSLSNLTGFWAVIALIIVFLLFGWIFYRLAFPHLIERIGGA